MNDDEFDYITKIDRTEYIESLGGRDKMNYKRIHKNYLGYSACVDKNKIYSYSYIYFYYGKTYLFSRRFVKNEIWNVEQRIRALIVLEETHLQNLQLIREQKLKKILN